MFFTLSIIFLALLAFGAAYYWLLLLAGAGFRGFAPVAVPRRRYVVLIAAHDEEAVIGDTVRQAARLGAPIHVVADHCRDATSARAREAGAIAHERAEGPRGSKAAALAWLYARLRGLEFDAVLLLDADARVEAGFLRAMDAALDRGFVAVQARQDISNPQAGWYAALASAMYLVENILHNAGRFRLGGSARHMGDSIVFRREIIDRFGFGAGLTEDHWLRQELLLAGHRIAYQPRAACRNEAAPTWEAAKAQRRRWMAGTLHGERAGRARLWRSALTSWAVTEAAVESLVPAYSTLALASAVGAATAVASGTLALAWLGLLAAVAALPFAGLVAARAPVSAYRALLAGPFFIVWRVGTSLALRVRRAPVTWVRTPHGAK